MTERQRNIIALALHDAMPRDSEAALALWWRVCKALAIALAVEDLSDPDRGKAAAFNRSHWLLSVETGRVAGGSVVPYGVPLEQRKVHIPS